MSRCFKMFRLDKFAEQYLKGKKSYLEKSELKNKLKLKLKTKYFQEYFDFVLLKNIFKKLFWILRKKKISEVTHQKKMVVPARDAVSEKVSCEQQMDLDETLPYLQSRGTHSGPFLLVSWHTRSTEFLSQVWSFSSPSKFYFPPSFPIFIFTSRPIEIL